MWKSHHPRGVLTLDGRTIDVRYDIPGIDDPRSGVAGGVVWFEQQDQQRFSLRERFQLETAQGLKRFGAITSIYSESAAVVVET